MKKNAEELLKYMIGLFIEYLEELNDAPKDCKQDEFIHGEKTAYVECLEIMQYWDRAEQFGLDFVVEDRFSLVE